MDEEDDLVPQPDSKGALNLSNRAWINLDPSLWTMSLKLIKLDLSYNHIVEIPSQIGEMIMLKELFASFNKITSIPPEIGRLKRLKKLYLNSNKIKTIPNEIGQLENLEELFLNENALQEIPLTIEKMVNLRILKLTNNKLRTLPYTIADLLTLETIDCANNPNLELLPASWRGDTESIIFICKLHQVYSIQMNEMKSVNKEISKHSQLVEQDCLLQKEKLAGLMAEIDDMKQFMRKKDLKRFEDKKKELEAIELDDKQDSNCVVS